MNDQDRFTADELHVILDAVAALSAQVKRRGAAPWRDYAGGPNDPKLNAVGYQRLLDAVDQRATDLLSHAPAVEDADNGH